MSSQATVAMEARRAAVVLSYAIRASVFTMVVLALWCQFDTQREGWILLWVGLVAAGGSIGLDYLVRVVCRLAEEDSE